MAKKVCIQYTPYEFSYTVPVHYDDVSFLIFWVGRKFQQNAKSVVCISTSDDTKFQDSRKTRTLNDEEKHHKVILCLISRVL